MKITQAVCSSAASRILRRTRLSHLAFVSVACAMVACAGPETEEAADTEGAATAAEPENRTSPGPENGTYTSTSTKPECGSGTLEIKNVKPSSRFFDGSFDFVITESRQEQRLEDGRWVLVDGQFHTETIKRRAVHGAGGWQAEFPANGLFCRLTFAFEGGHKLHVGEYGRCSDYGTSTMFSDNFVLKGSDTPQDRQCGWTDKR